MVSPENYADFVGKNVVLSLADEDVEGKIDQASPAGIAFKPRGRRDIVPYFPDDIKDIKVADKPPSKVKQRKLLPVADDKVKSHLASAHGWTLSVVNSLSQEDAVKEHDGIDHRDLGHNHEKTAEEAKSDSSE